MDDYADQTFKETLFPTESLSPHKESVSRFRDARIRIKNTYFNIEYAKVCVAFIGLILANAQEQFFFNELPVSHVQFGVQQKFLVLFSYVIFSVLSGILSYIYPAQNVLGISIFISTMLHMANQAGIDIFKEQINAYFFIQLCRNILFATGLPAFHGIWASLIQLHKPSLLHLPIVLFSIYEVEVYKFSILIDRFGCTSYRLGFASLAWCAVWIYMILKPNIVPSSKTISSSSAPTLSNIPWKPMFTSLPVLAIMITVVCQSLNMILRSMLTFKKFFDGVFNGYITMCVTYITMIITIIVLEFCPKIRFPSTISIRKFWTIAYLVFQALYYIVGAFTQEMKTDNLFSIVLNIIEILYAFGFVVNHMDIAPRYASILCGFMAAVKYLSHGMFSYYLYIHFKSNDPNEDGYFQVFIILLNLTAAIFYCIFASAEIQPWAKTYENGSQRESDVTAVVVN